MTLFDAMTPLLRFRLQPVLHAFLLALLALLLAGAGAARAQEGGGSVSIADFHAIIADGIADIETAEGDEAVQAVSQLQARLNALGGVELSTGVILHPDLSFIDPDDPDATLVRLRLLDSQLTLSANDDTDARLLLLDETLQELGLKKIETVLPHQVSEKPRQITAEGAAALGSLLKWGMILAGGILLVFILGSWLSGLLGSFVADAELHRRQTEGSAPITASQARQMASEMARTGNYREAVRHLYLSALFKLEESGFVPRDRSKTNRELLTAVAADARVSEHLQPVVDTFDRVWYGVREPDAATFRAYETEIDQLNQLLSSGPSRPENTDSSRKTSS